MQELTFVTGNPKKAEYFQRCIGFPLIHQKIDLDELQSLSMSAIVEHKVKQAYALLRKPVIVEDGSVEFDGLNGLPGPFIKFFLEKLDAQHICDLLSNKVRTATVVSVIGYCDGEKTKVFERRSGGQIALKPLGSNGFGWDTIFIPDGYTQTRAEMSQEDDEITYKNFKPFSELSEFLKTL